MSRHPAVQAYLDNKAKVDQDQFIGFVCRMAERSPHLAALCETPQYQAFKALMTDEKPFANILAILPELSPEDKECLIDSLPSSWERARIMDSISVTLSS